MGKILVSIKNIVSTFSFVVLCTLIFCVDDCFGNIISITKGRHDPVPFAINDFLVKGELSGNLAKMQEDIINIVKNDLSNTSLFVPVPKVSFIETKTGTEHTPLFPAWQQIGVNVLVNGSIENFNEKEVKVDFVIWDVVLAKKIVHKSMTLSKALLRRAGHKIANQVYNGVTGYEGYFDDIVVYVSKTGPYLKRQTRIAIMDQDGYNHKYLTDGKSLVLGPRFFPDGKSIIYLSYENKFPKLYVLNLETGAKKIFGNQSGMEYEATTFAPSFARDGKHILVSIAKSGNTHIYEINLETKALKKLTSGDTLNVSPSYSPDETKIVFTSNRSGGKQLFTMNKDGSDVKKLSVGSGSYFEPKWSSNNYIVFTKITEYGEFTLGVIHPDYPEEEKLIAKGYDVEMPSWATNRVITYTVVSVPTPGKSSGLSSIYMIDFADYSKRRLNTPNDGANSSWFHRKDQ